MQRDLKVEDSETGANQGSLDDILELADISRPFVTL